MPRPIDEIKANLPDVSEESEYELWSDRFGSWIGRDSSSRSPEPLRYLRINRKSGASSASPDFFEATGRRCSSDNGNDLTTNTDSFMIGQRVFVGGIKPGRITFIGEVHFAPGDWAGIVLDEAEGKNDGSVSGKRYFQCEPKKGIFSRLPRLTREPLPSASTPDGMSSLDTSFRSMTPGRSGTTSPTYSTTNVSRSPFGTKTEPVEINDRIIVKSSTGSRAGILRYRGVPTFSSGVWCGVEFDEPVGKNDGAVGGQRYFKCEPNHGLFVPESKVSLSPLSRKPKMSRANSQESLVSNITLGSLASTNTSKLRFNSTQKRLSALNKSPSAMSTTKPSFSLQDILREKSNHIEQLMKERENDREESATQAMLFKKKMDLFQDKITILTTQLEEERKKCEDLQFTIDETAATSPDESNTELKERITQLENELKRSNAKAGGDFVAVPGPTNQEMEQLQNDLREAASALQSSEKAKNTLEHYVKSLGETLAEVHKDLDNKSSRAKAFEEQAKNSLQSLEQRIQELESELNQKANEIEVNQQASKSLATSKDNRISELENELKVHIEAASNAESFKGEAIAAKDIKIAELNETIAHMTAFETEVKLAVAEKEIEIVRLNEKESLLNGRLQQIEENSNEKTENLTKKELELAALQNVLTTIEAEFLALQKTTEDLSLALAEKQKANEQLSLKIDENDKEMAGLKDSLEGLQTLTSNSDETLKKTLAIEEDLKSLVQKHSETKSALEADIVSKDSKIQDVEASLSRLETENNDHNTTFAELENKLKELDNVVVEKTSAIEKWTQDFKQLEADGKKSFSEIEEARNKAVDELNAAKIDFQTQLKADRETQTNALNAKFVELLAVQNEVVAQKDNELKDLSSKLIRMERGDEKQASQIQKLQKSLEELSSKLQQTETSKTEEANRLQEEKHKLEVDKNDLNRKLGANDEKITQLTDLKAALEKELEEIKNSAFDTNSEVTKLNLAMKEKQKAFEDYQNNAQEKIQTFQRSIDELNLQNSHLDQQCAKLKNELNNLQGQKIESENQLNQELQNIKSSSDEEKSTLNSELNSLRGTFDTERIQLNRKIQELQEKLENLGEEMEAKVRDLNADKETLLQEIEEVKLNTRESDSSMKAVIDEFKDKEAKIAAQLDEQRAQTDEAKKSLESLATSKDLLRDEYESKLQVKQNKILKLEADITGALELQKLTTGENEDKIKLHDDMQAQLYERDQRINSLTNQIENEVSQKKKFEESLELLKQQLREVEDEQVDLVNREEHLKVEKEDLQKNVEQLKEQQKSLEDKLKSGKKESESFRTSNEEQLRGMEAQIGNLQQVIMGKDTEKQSVDEKLRSRDEEIVQLQSTIKTIETKFAEKTNDTHSLLKTKDEKLTTLLDECSSKQNLIDDLKTNLENFQSCLKSTSSEKELSFGLVQKLNQDISERDSEIRELKMKIYAVEKGNKEMEDQVQNILGAKNQFTFESQAKINDLEEQIQILEQVKHEEVEALSSKLNLLQSHMKLQENASQTDTSNLKLTQKRENELTLMLKDLELRETELMLSNQSMKRKLEEIESSHRIPETGEVYDKEMQSHIEFLNSIISDMHKKNLKLQQKVDILGAGPTSSDASGNAFSMDFLNKKKPAPRLYCDICEEFDSHDTEDCPTQSSGMDEPAPKEKKNRKLPPPRVYCDHCEEFDLHETENCLNEEETY